MPKIALTDAFVRGTKCVTGELVEWADLRERGLSLRVTSAGVKSWTLRYRDAGGQQKRISLGRLDDVSLVEARGAAATERAKIHDGVDPVIARKKAKAEAVAGTKLETMKEVGERYFAEAAHGRHRPNGQPKRSATISAEKAYFDKHVVASFGKEKLADLTRARVQAFLNTVADKHSLGAASQCRVVLQGIYTFATWQEIAPTDPCQFVSVKRFEARDRVLTDSELQAVWRAFNGAAGHANVFVSRPVALAVLLAATTLQRRAEVTGMRKAELDLERRLWTIAGERTKNHRTHVVPLSDLAARLIGEAIALSGESEFVFPSPRDKRKPILPSALSHAFRRMTSVTEVEGARPHDLRRTGATNLTSERIGVPRFTVSKVLNHVSDSGGGSPITAVYDRNAYLPEKRRALDAWAGLLAEIVEGEPAR